MTYSADRKVSQLMILILIQCVIIIALLVVLLFSVNRNNEPSNASPQAVLNSNAYPLADRSIFQRSINDAAIKDKTRVVRNLFALNKQNNKLQYKDIDGVEYVKAVSWMRNGLYKKWYEGKSESVSPNLFSGEMWVTLVPQVQNFCSSLSVENPSFRLKQYLGLNPNRDYDRFVEIWVKPQDIIRPCRDPDPTDNTCLLDEPFPEDGSIRGINDYQAFFEYLYQSTYSPSGAPWTRLGYTYDWAFAARGVGASEYMLLPDSSYLIASSYTTKEYCGMP